MTKEQLLVLKAGQVIIKNLDPSIKTNTELVNKFLKCCKYYQSYDILDNQMIQILSEEYNDGYIADYLDWPEEKVWDFKDNNEYYYAFKTSWERLMSEHPRAIPIIGSHEGFVSVYKLKQLKAMLNNK